jgi:NAD(P)-dependent dehydrogenase (short-subunit alcohol dehydrogenase family)
MNDKRSIRGRCALVTGAASGIGRATATLFAAEGASVAATDVSDAGLLVPIHWATFQLGLHPCLRVDYRDVVVVDGCAPSYQFCRTYAGSVQVLTATTLHGQIDCRERWTTCTLTVLQLGINGAPLDDIIDPVLARWEALYGQLMLKLQNHRWK